MPQSSAVMGSIHPDIIEVSNNDVGLISRIASIRQKFAKGVDKNHPNYRGLEIRIDSLEKRIQEYEDGTQAKQTYQNHMQAADRFAENDLALFALGLDIYASRESRRKIAEKFKRDLFKNVPKPDSHKGLSAEIGQLSYDIDAFIRRLTRKSNKSYNNNSTSIDFESHQRVQLPNENPLSQVTPQGQVYIQLGKISTRIDTIHTQVQASRKMTSYKQTELEGLRQKVMGINISGTGEGAALRDSILQRIKEIFALSAQSQDENGSSEQELAPIPIPEVHQVSRNDVAKEVDYLKELLNHIRNISSRYQNDVQAKMSEGDGSARQDALSPLLRGLEILLKENTINSKNFSWSDVVDKFDYKSEKRYWLLLKGIARKYKNAQGLRDNLMLLITMVEDLSRVSGCPLRVLIGELKEFIGKN